MIRVTSVLHVATVLAFLVGLIVNQQVQDIKKTDRKRALLLPILFKVTNAIIWWLVGFIPFILLERFLTFFDKVAGV